MSVNEVYPGVWVGDMGSYDEFLKDKTGVSLCVLEGGCPHATCMKIPILVDFRASAEQLEKAAQWIEQFWADKVPVLVHCGGGVERSPLTVAYWLVKRRGFSWKDAYKLLMEKRVEVQDRTAWLPTNEHGELP